MNLKVAARPSATPLMPLSVRRDECRPHKHVLIKQPHKQLDCTLIMKGTSWTATLLLAVAVVAQDCPISVYDADRDYFPVKASPSKCRLCPCCGLPFLGMHLVHWMHSLHLVHSSNASNASSPTNPIQLPTQ